MSNDPAGHDAFAARLDPVENVLGDSASAERAGDDPYAAPSVTDADSDSDEASPDDAAHDAAPIDAERLASIEERLTALEADLDAVRGLLDGVDAVDEAVERRASIALAKVEALEREADAEERGLVRERIPETGADDPETRAGTRADSTGRDSAADREPTRDATAKPDRRLGSGTDAAASFDGSDTASRTPDATDGTAERVESAGGAVGRAPNAGGSTDCGSDASLASRLRGVFR